jgi:hypothetical protein
MHATIEQGYKTRSEQRLGKHVLAGMNTHAIIEERRFRCGPRREVISMTIKLTRLVVSCQLRVDSSGELFKGGYSSVVSCQLKVSL